MWENSVQKALYNPSSSVRGHWHCFRTLEDSSGAAVIMSKAWGYANHNGKTLLQLGFESFIRVFIGYVNIKSITDSAFFVLLSAFALFECKTCSPWLLHSQHYLWQVQNVQILCILCTQPCIQICIFVSNVCTLFFTRVWIFISCKTQKIP